MGITVEKKEVAPGIFKEFFQVFAEGINKYTCKRVQKKRRGITSRLKAERVYRELWNLCREERPDDTGITRWGQLKDSFLEYVLANVRTPENPNGFNPRTPICKKSRFVYLGHWDEMHLDLITPHFVTTELDKLETLGKASRSLTAEIQKEIRSAFSYGLERGVVKTHPLFELKRRKVPKKKKMALTHEEAKRLLSEAKARKHPYFLIWLMSLATGLRRSELAGLKWTDLDFVNRIAHLRRQKMPNEGVVEQLKNYNDRTVAIPVFAIPDLLDHHRMAKSEFVVDVDCKEWARGNQSLVLKAFCIEIGIRVVTHHQLRATFITLALVDGVSLGIVKENVGHRKLSTTDEYFRSSGIEMSGKTDGLKLDVPA